MNRHEFLALMRHQRDRCFENMEGEDYDGFIRWEKLYCCYATIVEDMEREDEEWITALVDTLPKINLGEEKESHDPNKLVIEEEKMIVEYVPLNIAMVKWKSYLASLERYLVNLEQELKGTKT